MRSLTPELSKGLEFDLVVLVDPDRFGEGIEGAVDRYVAMTRATQELVIPELRIAGREPSNSYEAHVVEGCSAVEGHRLQRR